VHQVGFLYKIPVNVALTMYFDTYGLVHNSLFCDRLLCGN
jgi:hypothetical protein